MKQQLHIKTHSFRGGEAQSFTEMLPKILVSWKGPSPTSCAAIFCGAWLHMPRGLAEGPQ